MIESHSSPEHYTASMLYRFNKKKARLEQIKRVLETVRQPWEPKFHYKMTKRLHVVTAMKEVLYSEIIKYSPHR